ncbi:MAG: peptidoglycan-binding protein [Myxococcales bacterium]|nr:peptidoglycan-binding protein [Myxococcales bacterium]
MSDHEYQRAPLTLATGDRHRVKLPPRVMRGRLTGFLFDTNKTFILPAALTGIRGLASFYAAHPGLKVLVTGHTDTVGPGGANLSLSDERAGAVAAFLVDDVDAWLKHYAGTPGSSAWGTREDQHMLTALPDGGPPYYAGPVHGQLDAATQDAVRRFQTDRGLAVDGAPGPATRRALVTDYMSIDGTSLPAGTDVARHGCGEHHNAVPTPDETDEQANRRVEVFFFEGPVEAPAPAPLPRARLPRVPRVAPPHDPHDRLHRRARGDHRRVLGEPRRRARHRGHGRDPRSRPAPVREPRGHDRRGATPHLRRERRPGPGDRPGPRRDRAADAALRADRRRHADRGDGRAQPAAARGRSRGAGAPRQPRLRRRRPAVGGDALPAQLRPAADRHARRVHPDQAHGRPRWRCRMSIQTYAALAPTDHTASVIFALATPTDTPVMRQARQWVDALVAAAPDSSVAFEFGRNLSFVDQLEQAMIKVHKATMPVAVQDATFGGVRGHVLVIIAPPIVGPGSGIRAFTGAKGVELTITAAQVTAAAGPTKLEHDADALALWIALLTAGKFLSVCLVPTAAGSPLDEFAKALSKRTQCLVYGSNTPLEFTTDAAGAVTGARVGAATSVATGKTYVAHDAVTLAAKADTFLPGAEFFYWPGSP